MEDERPRLNYIDFDEGGITGAGEQGWDDLEPEIRERVEQDFREGITYSIDFKARKRPHRITAIHWRLGPGPYAMPNKLAETLIDKVKGPMKLELDGHWYLISPLADEDR